MIHFSGDCHDSRGEGSKNRRPLIHFYAFMMHANALVDSRVKRFARDRLRYRDNIFCKASQVIFPSGCRHPCCRSFLGSVCRVRVGAQEPPGFACVVFRIVILLPALRDVTRWVRLVPLTSSRGDKRSISSSGCPALFEFGTCCGQSLINPPLPLTAALLASKPNLNSVPLPLPPSHAAIYLLRRSFLCCWRIASAGAAGRVGPLAPATFADGI